jgi:hypothetical protein
MKCSYITGTCEKLYLSEVKLNSADRKEGVITSAVQGMRIVKISYIYYCGHPTITGGGVAVYIEYLLTEIDLGSSSGHFGFVD